MLKLYMNGEVPVTFKKFPAGETLVRVEDGRFEEYNAVAQRGLIMLNYTDNSDIFDLLLLVDAVRRRYPKLTHLSLNMPYLPYARQDRVCSKGESLSVKVVADLINSCNFNSVVCCDIHSEVGVALLNNLRHVEQVECTATLAERFGKEHTVIVSPDAGASKKAAGFAKAYGFPFFVQAEKHRDMATGNITHTSVPTFFFGNKDILVLDDICDGGRTFIELAKVLRPVSDGKIFLYVTHGIFSAGVNVLSNYFDGIYVSNLMNPDAANNPRVIQLN